MTDTTAQKNLRYAVGNMSCGGCAARAEKAMNAVPGVREARVNFATRRAEISGDGTLSPDALSRAMEAAGYPVAPVEGSTPEAEDPRAIRTAFLWALALTLPVFVVEMGGHLFPAFHHWLHGLIGQGPLRLMQLVLTTMVLAGPGRVFFRLGIPALLRRAPEMNSLVALGAGTAWAWSTLVTLVPGLMPEGAVHVYFEAAAVIVTLILLGRWLEARARGQAGAAIAGLMALSPDTALRIDTGGEFEVPLSDIVTGDLLRLRPGARVPVDGSVESGHSNVDEAMLTGEPIPVAKGAGDKVSAGTVNKSGSLTIRAEAIGADTALGRIVRMVEDAQAIRLPVQALINKVTAVFVPAVLLVAVLAAAIWLAVTGDIGRALVTLVSVLIIACPCAMGLATPVSILAGTGRGAELGILFRKGDALQALGQVDLVAFDKTGTLTEGRPEVVSVQGDPQTLAIAASVEALSEHPLAQAIVRAAHDLPLRLVDEFQSFPGGGVAARMADVEILVGSAAFLRGHGVMVPGRSGDETVVHVSEGGAWLGVIELSDQVKADAGEAVRLLKQAGIRVAMLSGDAQAPVDKVAFELGIEDARGGLSPEAKKSALNAWQGDGLKVAFVGDGINDAPVLAAADVGIALGTGTDVAMEAAEIVLTKGAPAVVPVAITISQRTLKNIKENLIWAFGYNVALIPVAAGVLVPFGGPALNPMLAAFAMAASSVLVVGNALRLRRIGRGA